MRKQDRKRLIGLAMVLAFASFVSQIPHVEAGATLALDGSGSGSSVGGNCVWSQKLTTSNKPDVIVAMLAINDTTTTVTSITDTASPPLQWTLRANRTEPANVQIVYYYAIASVPLSADSVTFGLSSARVATVCVGFGVSGADTSVPFDPNVGMPNKNGGLSTTASLTYNTSDPNDFLIVLEGFCAQGAAGSGSPSGFTPVDGGNVRPSNCVAEGFQSVIYYEIVSTTQSSNSVSWPFDNADSPFAVIGDAIQSTLGPLSASVPAGSNAVDVGQLASFTCSGTGGLSPYSYSWAFGDGSTGSGASVTHIYNTPGTMTVVCTVKDQLGTANDQTQVLVSSVPSITSFTASPASLSAGEKVTLSVSTSGGYGSLTYSYANLPAGCLSANATTISCTPTSSGNYRITATVTDRSGESATSTVPVTVGPQRIFGLPQVLGLAVIFGSIGGLGAIVTLSVVIALRRKKRRHALNAR